MRKLSKILAAVLLVSVLLGAFGIFASFAAEPSDTAVAEKSYGTIKYDMDSKTSILPSNTVETTKYEDYPKVGAFGAQDGSPLTEDGQTVWNLYYDVPEDKFNGTDPNSQDFINTISNSRTNILIRDDTDDNKKNTDYIVFDMDVATDTEFIDDIYFNLRLYAANGASTSLGATSIYPAIFKTPSGDIGISNADGSNKLYRAVDTESKWTNITIVYDFSNVVEVDAETGEEVVTAAIVNKAYCYIDGYYVGNITAFGVGKKINVSVLQFARMQTNNSGSLSVPNASTKIANLTIKTFENGYEGLMTEAGILGNEAITLHGIDELKYCVSGTPGTPNDYTGHKIADITRTVDGVETVIPVYDVDDLNGDLLDGDVVTAYADLKSAKSYYAVKMISKTTTTVDETTGEEVTTTADVAANIVWQDKNGIVLGAEGSLWSAVTVVNVPSNAAYAMIRTDKNTLYNSGVNSHMISAEEAGTASPVIYDPMFHALPSSGTYDIVFFEDYIAYGRSYADTVTLPEGSPYSQSSSSSSANQCSGAMTFDLNGHTFTHLSPRTHWLASRGGFDVKFKNGTLVNNAGGNNLAMLGDNYKARLIFENLTMDIKGTMLDHRDGIVSFVNCDITAASTLANSKVAGWDDHTTVMVDDCTVSTNGYLFHLAQPNASGTGRYGSGTIFATVFDTTVTKGALFNTEYYANASGHTADIHTVNKVRHFLTVTESDVNSGNSQVIFETIGSLPVSGENPLNARTYIDITDSKIVAKTLASIYPRTVKKEYVDFITYIDTVRSDFILSDDLVIPYDPDNGAPVKSEVEIVIGEGCRFNKAGEDTLIQPIVLVENGGQLAYTSNEGEYNLIATTSYDTYTYQLGTKEAVPFYWNKPAEGTDEVNIDKVVTLATSDLYKYTWTKNDNAFTTLLEKTVKLHAKSNLVLCDDFYFNLYVLKADYDLAGVDIVATDILGNVIEAAAETVIIEDAEYVKFQAKNIAPAMAEQNVINVEITVNGAYGDSVSATNALNVLDYTDRVLADDDESNDAIILAILNYIAEAYDYARQDKSNVIDALVGKEFRAVDTTDAKLGGADDLKIALNYGAELNWVIKAEKAMTVTYTYTVAGNTYTATKECYEGEIFYIAVKAYDMLETITVNGAEVNLAGYYGALTDDDAKEMVAAIYNYAFEALAYKNATAN